MRRKFLSVVLCVCMMLTMAPFAFAAENPAPSPTSVSTLDELKNALSAAAAAESGDTTITLSNSITLNEGDTWTPIDVDGYHGAGVVTIDGQGNTITNLSAPLFSGGFAGNSGIVIKNLTIDKAVIHDTTNSLGLGAFVCSVDSMPTITLENCHLTNSTIVSTGGARVGGLVGWTSGYNNTNNGPVDTYVTITNCSVENCNINAKGSVGAIIGHAGTNPATYHTINHCTVTDTVLNSTDDGDWRAGIVVGTVNVGQVTIDDITSNGNTVTQTGKAAPEGQSDLYGRFVPGTSGLLVIDGTPVTGGAQVASIGSKFYTSLASAVAAANTGDTIKLVQDINLETNHASIPKAVTLDLSGHKLTSAHTIYTLFLSTETNVIDSVGGGIIENTAYTEETGTVSNFGVAAVVSGENANVTFNGISLKGNKPLFVQVNGKATLTNSKIVGGSVGVSVYGNNNTGNPTSLTVNAGTEISARDYAISGNGDPKNAGTEITITGGTIRETGSNGGGAIYHPQNGKLSISGDTLIEGENGIQLCSGEGVIANITGGTIRATGADQRASKTGDGFIPDGAALSVVNRNYPGGTPKMNISGGYFSSAKSGSVLAYTWSNNTASEWNDVNEYLSISGGYYTNQIPSSYCATGFTVLNNNDATYQYKVGKISGNSDNTINETTAKGETTTDVSKITESNRLAAESVAKSVTPSDLSAANVTISNSDKSSAVTELVKQGAVIVDDNGKITGGKIVTVVKQAYLDVEITSIDTTANTATVEMNISPKYNLIAVATTGTDVVDPANGYVIDLARPLTVTTPTEVSVTLPDVFKGKAIYIKHSASNGKVYYYTAMADKTTGLVKFTTKNGFSPFVFSLTNGAVAEVNGTGYDNFQDAVDAVENGGTIKALKDITSTVSGNKTFTVTGSNVTLSAAPGYNLSKNGNTYTVSTRSSSSSGSTSTTYAVNVNAATNGTVAADKKTASKGTTVTVTASPSKGYVVDAVKVVDKDGKDVAVTEKDGKYVFTMPASAVTVTGSFKAETPAPVALPFTDVKSGNWFYDAVKYAYEQGLMTGTSATTFAPNGTMNRAMIVTVLYRLEKSPAVTGASKFTDVPAGQWYSDAVAWAAANKIVNGYDETTFGPMNAVTREQMAAILFRYEQVKGLENVTLEENLNRFPDQNKISAYAIPALQWAVGQKIINGNADGTLDPTGTATRAQVAQIFTNLLNK